MDNEYKTIISTDLKKNYLSYNDKDKKFHQVTFLGHLWKVLCSLIQGKEKAFEDCASTKVAEGIVEVATSFFSPYASLSLKEKMEKNIQLTAKLQELKSLVKEDKNKEYISKAIETLESQKKIIQSDLESLESEKIGKTPKKNIEKVYLKPLKKGEDLCEAILAKMVENKDDLLDIFNKEKHEKIRHKFSNPVSSFNLFSRIEEGKKTSSGIPYQSPPVPDRFLDSKPPESIFLRIYINQKEGESALSKDNIEFGSVNLINNVLTFDEEAKNNNYVVVIVNNDGEAEKQKKRFSFYDCRFGDEIKEKTENLLNQYAKQYELLDKMLSSINEKIQKEGKLFG